MIKKQPPRVLPNKAPPFMGLVNTDKITDTGSPHDAVEEYADKNRSCFGAQPRPKEFQPFFRYHGANTGAIMSPNTREVISKEKDIGQPTSLAYAMESQAIKLKLHFK